jgi:hypothetical protein
MDNVGIFGKSTILNRFHTEGCLMKSGHNGTCEHATIFTAKRAHLGG